MSSWLKLTLALNWFDTNSEIYQCTRGRSFHGRSWWWIGRIEDGNDNIPERFGILPARSFTITLKVVAYRCQVRGQLHIQINIGAYIEFWEEIQFSGCKQQSHTVIDHFRSGEYSFSSLLSSQTSAALCSQIDEHASSCKNQSNLTKLQYSFGIFGIFEDFLDAFGFFGILLGFYRDSFGDFWDSVGILEDFLGFSEYCLMDSMGFFGVLLGFYRDYFGDFWDSVGIFRIFDDILGSSGYCSMDSIGFLGFWWDLRDSFWEFWDSVGIFGIFDDWQSLKLSNYS